MFDICVLGDALIDMFRGDGADAFIASCGGTALNMAVCAAKMGLQVAFLGRVGDDIMGERLVKTMEAHGIDLTGLVKDDQFFTTLSFVELHDGERNFSFSRQYGADIMLYPENIDHSVIDRSRLFHYSGMVLTKEPGRSTSLSLLKQLHEKGVYICTDISYRYNLWESESVAVEVVGEALRYTDLVKCSEEEAFLMSGKETLGEAADFFLGIGCKVCIITCGGQGAFYCMDGQCGTVPSYSVKVVDTTGAGDAFFGGFLYQLMQLKRPEELRADDLPGMLRFANAAGALNICQKGGAEGAPTLEAVLELMGKG